MAGTVIELKDLSNTQMSALLVELGLKAHAETNRLGNKKDFEKASKMIQVEAAIETILNNIDELM